ncbi:MAG TPA: hypothetical protein VHX90_00485, partial [Verrucomicrobiae bacterium]|nr:hypothetical protein [Verrucomicrobiae bacterium]
MCKKSCFYCIGCLVLGLAAGYFYAQVRAGHVIADTFATLEMTDLGESSERAQNAYQHESIPVAIYALTELLDKQKTAEQIGETPFISRQIISIDLMLTHARLAKLYAEAGQTNLSVQHIDEALNYAKADNKLTITNQDELM